FQAVEAICPEVQDKEFKSQKETALILLTPQGQRYHQKKAMELAQKKKLVFICGRYEGFDERVRLGLPVEEISIGDYVLSGGEIPAMVILDSVIRLLPGALGDHESTKQESFTTHLLDFPQYTRPPEFRGMKVPQVLLSGNHGEIEKWRNLEAYKRTKERRKDLLLEE
ncbi:MAG: tRNA (guanosine(37)-N1)-methyltransferase TrmD, partial [Planctomycetota bacterium]